MKKIAAFIITALWHRYGMLLIAGFCLLLLTGCGGGADSGLTASGETGSLAFSITVNADSYYQPAADSPSGDICEDYGITAIRGIIVLGEAPVRTVSWECRHHTGSMSGILVGSGYRLVLEGMVSDEPLWRGERPDITIVENEEMFAGEVALNYVGATSDEPDVNATTPGRDDEGVFLTTDITVKFNNPVVKASVEQSQPPAIGVVDVDSGGASVSGVISYDENSLTATFDPADPLRENTEYSVTVGTEIESLTGSTMRIPYSFSFTTVDLTAPTAGILSPADGEEDVPTDARLVAQFNEAINGSTLSPHTFRVEAGAGDINVPIHGDIVFDATLNQATFSPTGGLDHNRTYTITLTTGIRDTSGNPLAADIQAEFISANVAWIEEGGKLVKFSSAQEELVAVDVSNLNEENRPLGHDLHFAIDPNDNSLWTADPANNRIIKVSRDGRLLRILFPVDQPRGIAVDPRDGSVWTSEYVPASGSHKLVKRSPTGFALLETTAGVGIALRGNVMDWYAGDNSLWVVDRVGHELIKLFGEVPDGYDIVPATGDHHRRIGGFTNEALSVSAFQGDGINSGHIWAADRSGFVRRFDIDGTFLGAWTPSGFSEVHTVSSDPVSGAVWAGVTPGGAGKLSFDGVPLINLSEYTSFFHVEGDPMDEGGWVGFGAGLAKLEVDGTEAWRRNSDGSSAVVLEPGLDVGRTIYVDGAIGVDTSDSGSMMRPYATIEAGLAATRRGDTVRVAAGTYIEHVRLQSFVHLAGQDPLDTTIQGNGGSNVVSATGIIGAQISGFTITGAGVDGYGIRAIDCNGLVIRDCQVKDNSNDTFAAGVRLDGATRALVMQNIISGNSHGGISVACENAILSNNLIFNNGDSGIFCTANTTTDIRNNVIHANGTQAVGRSGIIAFSGVITIENNSISFNGNSAGDYGVWGGSSAEVNLRHNNTFRNYQGPFFNIDENIENIDLPEPLDNPYMDPDQDDFHLLQSASTYIDRGRPPWRDVDGTPVDVGAYGGPWGDW